MFTAFEYIKNGARYKSEGDFESAKLNFIRALEFDNENTSALNELGLLLHDSGEYNEAIKYFEQSLDVKPSGQLALFYLGSCYLHLGQPRMAIASLERLSLLNMEYPGLNLKLASVYETTHDLKNELRCYSDAVQLSPKDPAVYEARGKFFERTGKIERALEDYKQISAINFKNPKSYYDYIRVCVENGYKSEAELAISQALLLDPQDGYILNLQQQLKNQ